MVSGDIADFQIETSSNPAHSHYARAFNSMKAWCPSLEDKERWLMVNFEKQSIALYANKIN
jgi:hypothetical protein